jgi:coenzyme F420 hydrogenase subunit beta
MPSRFTSIDEAQLCSACGLCAGTTEGAIQLEAGHDGFDHPQGQLADSELETLISTCCPGNLVERPVDRSRSTSPLWGTVHSCWTGHATDEKTRYAGASGGAISALAIHLLESKLVDGILQIGANPTAPTESRPHISTNSEDVLSCSGSRYSPSSLLSVLGETLKEVNRIAVIGRPCEISSLASWKALNPELEDRIPWLISFFCAGIPSRHGTSRLLEAMGVHRKDLTSFRYRGEGWPGYAKATSKDGSTHKISYEDSWGKILNRHLHFRCKICPDGSAGSADIVCGDAWEENDGYPKFTDAPGKSVIITRTSRGESLLDSARAAKKIACFPFSIHHLKKIQPYQAMRNQVLVARLAAMRLRSHQVPKYVGFSMLQNLVSTSIFQVLRNFVGMWKRIKND